MTVERETWVCYSSGMTQSRNAFTDLLALSQTFDGKPGTPGRTIVDEPETLHMHHRGGIVAVPVLPWSPEDKAELTVTDVERAGGLYAYGPGGTRVPLPVAEPEDDPAADRVIVICFGHVGEDNRWVPSHLDGLPGDPVALNAGHEVGHAIDYLVRHGWAVVSPFAFRSKHHSSAWVRRIETGPAPGMGYGPELAWVAPARLDTSDRRVTAKMDRS